MFEHAFDKLDRHLNTRHECMASTCAHCGAVDKVSSENVQWEYGQKKDAHWRHFMAHINRFRFKAVAERRQ